ncbi:hypothetical protein SAMN02745824_0347 [Parasphingorhabdus marina DSM 22363]|uniref:DUF4350 domain-containing protein n=1 Tax=Parasphingorhabdus marina DSM 22363 TaxID=1123272 RepID=A0A1N6CMK8_9SPHN|nr:hypothetical protein [Parasphingorhabdus marina]SIN59810.1 hypothetical protein SAMN02745824_0347 [Parasphingorhabdus marina DSM 22363]
MSVQTTPFRRNAVLIMFLVGFVAFIALLYGLGTGDRLASGKNGQAHGASNSIVGYKALASALQKTGTPVEYSRSPSGFDKGGLLILTPAPFSDPEKLYEIVENRAYAGPTMIILPKWNVAGLPTLKKGWVQRLGLFGDEMGVRMLGEIAEVELSVPEEPADGSKSGSPVSANSAIGSSVPRPANTVTITGPDVRAIVRDPETGNALVAYLDDGGVYPQLESLDESQIENAEEADASYFPVVLVADPDLLNNAGMANRATAAHALALIEAVSTGTSEGVTFDLTFNGLGSAENLLTLAFEPPFLSATICLILAALAAAWMAFNRFGPPTRDKRSIEFGKTALVNNSAGFIRRMQRDYLVADPYADLIQKQAARAAGFSPAADPEDVRRKLDDLGEVDGNRFTALVHELTRATNSRETAERAAALYQWKKEKTG